jgi:hypothetical protein
MTFLKIVLFEVHIAKWIINCQMDKTKFTLGKFSFPVFFATNCNFVHKAIHLPITTENFRSYP